MKPFITGKKNNKTVQYAVGGVVAVIILAAWFSSPLMNNSSYDSSSDSAGFFKTKKADVSSLGSEIPAEGGAPGFALNGAMLNNPAMSGENIAASLFQSGPDDNEVSLDEKDKTSAGDEADSAVASAGAHGSGAASAGLPAPSGPKAKLSAMPSITAGNAASMTAGGTHNKFFGAGGAKAELTPLSNNMSKTTGPGAPRGALTSMLQKSAERSAQAAKLGFTPDMGRSAASSAFDRGPKTGSSDLTSDMEAMAQNAGMDFAGTAQSLKANDPQLSKKEVTLPKPEEVKNKEEFGEAEIKKLIITALINNVLGPMFGTMAGALLNSNFDDSGQKYNSNTAYDEIDRQAGRNARLGRTN